MTDFRALIIEMANELDHISQCLLDNRQLTNPLADKARAALDEIDGPAVPLCRSCHGIRHAYPKRF